eukprot:196217-Chlamydomonas_euryale.AAC.1
MAMPRCNWWPNCRGRASEQWLAIARGCSGWRSCVRGTKARSGPRKRRTWRRRRCSSRLRPKTSGSRCASI